MKILNKITILLLVLTSCKSKKSLFPDYSNNASEPILLIKNQVENSKGVFDVQITNKHGGSYVVNSRIDVGKDSILIKNDIHNNFYGTKSDTTLTFSKEDFIKLLDFELSLVETQLRIAGTYQDIKITVQDSINMFYTRQGYGIMKLMEDGKSNTIKAE